MIRRILVLAVVVSTVVLPGARAQVPTPDAAVVAEGEGRWDDAIRLHRAVLDTDPLRTDLWIRIADIEARRGNLTGCIAALQNAAASAPATASIYFRLSQAYAMAEQPAAAIKAVEGALVLEPNSVDYLRARATLATWIADYSRAQDSYRRLTELDRDDVAVALALARVSAWGGNTDEAVTQYGRYLNRHPEAADAWIELAKAESWRGNYGGAVRALEEYRSRFGETTTYSQELAAIMASGGRPQRAEDILTPLLEQSPDSYELNLTHTIALAMQHRAREAFTSLDTVRRLAPESRETRDAERMVRVMLASSAEPRFNVYSDSDMLQMQRFAPQATVALVTGTQISAGYDRTTLDARLGSGLEQVDGSTSAEYQHSWAGVSQKLGALTLDAQGGYATAGPHDAVTYAVGATARAGDRLLLSVHRTSDAVVISPRTVGLGLTQIGHRVQIEWAPSLQSVIAFDGLYQELSDGNHRLELTVAPRRSFARRAGFNLDLGVSAYRLQTDLDLTNGYYDPRRYEYYAFTAYPYFKITENNGLSISTAIGAQRDYLRSASFQFGATVSGEATFGIYEPWVLKVNGSASMNRRLESGAFRGFSGGVVLVRRF